MTGATPIATPASVGSRPVLILAQNSRSLARGCDGAPGDRNGARPVTSLIQFDGLPTTPSSIEVLLPPVEPSVYTSIAFTDRLIDEGIDPSVGSVGDAYDNSMAESQIGLYKSELIHHEGPWRNVDQVEAATADWVHWFNTERTHSSIDDLTPIELEGLDYALTEPLERAG
jgi:hypothetical protein